MFNKNSWLMVSIFYDIISYAYIMTYHVTYTDTMRVMDDGYYAMCMTYHVSRVTQCSSLAV